MAYLRWEELASELGIPTPSEADKVQLTEKIAEAQAILEARMGMRWEALQDSTRYFDPIANTYHGVLYLGMDIAQITTVTNGDGTVISGAQYIVHPSYGPPYQAIKLRGSSGVQWAYVDDPYDAIAITGRWAYSVTAPPVVKRSCRRLAAWLYRQKDTGIEVDRIIYAADGSTIMPASFPRDVFSPLASMRRFT